MSECIRVKDWCGRIGTLVGEPTLRKTEDGIPVYYECRVRWDDDWRLRCSYAIWDRLEIVTGE